MNDDPRIRELELPSRFERRFSLHLYWVSHGLLLLRSGKSSKDAARIDILFQDVIWMALPAWWDTLEISSSTVDALPFPVPASLKNEIQFRRVFRIATDGVAHFVVAGRVSIAEDDRNHFEDSLLLPDLRVMEAYPQ